ncbi:MAG: hypothetical protein WAT78_06425 [Rhizobiaceae bacterium]
MRLRLAILAVFAATPVLADRIDGDWCNEAGRHVRIDGPEIELPSGAMHKGDYDRHAFRYIAPPGDPDAGTQIRMMVQSDEEMLLFRGDKADFANAEQWRRCEATS